ncbi:MAG: DUF3124 domain-containing protein [Planctomycetota bacterium]|jgi:hypothetical protein
MTKEQKYPDWFLWLWERGFLVGSIVGLIVFVTVMGLGYYLDQRLDGIAATLAYEPPRQYEEPDLEAYAAEDVSPESIAVQRAVYVPIYSHVYYHQGRPYSLEATLSIRNTDTQRPVHVRSVRYYDTNGKLVKTHVDRLIRLAPLQTIEFLVEAQDSTGGSGANFIVEWLAPEDVNEPIVEAVMVGATGTQGICFRVSGKALTSSGVDRP